MVHTARRHGPKNEFGQSWFALANGRDADTSGHKTSGKRHRRLRNVIYRDIELSMSLEIDFSRSKEYLKEDARRNFPKFLRCLLICLKFSVERK